MKIEIEYVKEIIIKVGVWDNSLSSLISTW